MDRFDYKGLVLSEGPLVWTKKLHLEEAGSQGCSYDPVSLILRNWFFTVKADQIPPRKMCPFAFPFISVPVPWYKMYFRVRVTQNDGAGHSVSLVSGTFGPVQFFFFFFFEGLRPRIKLNLNTKCVWKVTKMVFTCLLCMVKFVQSLKCDHTEICWF